MIDRFATRLLAWYDEYGRKDLPWHKNADPYQIWLSEVMLQQTQVKTVIPYFEKFLTRFPKVTDLAEADEDEVLHLWSGLGYYARARNLHHAAKQVVNEFSGEVPCQQEELESLKGIGRSTAAAIRAQAYGEPAAILDGNVKRVLARLFAEDEWPGKKAAENRLWQHSEALLPESRIRDYTQAIMDLGSLVCTRASPDCEHCPFQIDCEAFRQQRVDQLPTRKPKKATPVRQTTFLILRNPAREVLLEKRPPMGIWGGLWSFPEVSEDCFHQKLAGFRIQGANQRTLESGQHVFSHFRLNYQPLLVDVQTDPADGIYEAGQYIWYSAKQESKAVGLAAPVAKLLEQLDDIHTDDQNRIL